MTGWQGGGAWIWGFWDGGGNIGEGKGLKKRLTPCLGEEWGLRRGIGG
jgi:hypothetical protein